MNSQFLPGAPETLNKETHSKLLREASTLRRIRKAARKQEGSKSERRFLAGPTPGFRRPSLLEPAFSALLTVIVALQIASLVAS